MSRSVGALIVRSWLEPGAEPDAFRARVLAISGPDSEMQELGVAAGLPAILELVEQGLRTVVALGDRDNQLS